MTCEELLAMVATRPDMDVNVIEGVTYVRHFPTKACFEVTGGSDSPWSQIEGVLVGRRPQRALSHMTRVIGYYSLIENWNMSKIGELAARHAGDYAVSVGGSIKGGGLPWRPMESEEVARC